MNFNKSKVIDIYDSNGDGSSSDPEFIEQSIKKKVKVSKLMDQDGFLKKLNSSVIDGLSMHKSTRKDLSKMVSRS